VTGTIGRVPPPRETAALDIFELHLTEIARVVQMAIAPAFMLAGIGTFINVMTTRLARVIDRAVESARDGDFAAKGEEEDAVARLRDMLAIRAKLLNRALALCTVAAVLICGLIGLMFLDALVRTDLSTAIVLLFIVAMLTMMSGLALFMREVFVATAALRGRHIRSARAPLRVQA
jgi:hypothetical protein